MIASFFRTGQSQLFAQEIEQARACVHGNGHLSAIDLHMNIGGLHRGGRRRRFRAGRRGFRPRCDLRPNGEHHAGTGDLFQEPAPRLRREQFEHLSPLARRHIMRPILWLLFIHLYEVAGHRPGSRIFFQCARSNRLLVRWRTVTQLRGRMATRSLKRGQLSPACVSFVSRAGGHTYPRRFHAIPANRKLEYSLKRAKTRSFSVPERPVVLQSTIRNFSDLLEPEAAHLSEPP
jgi:hypothetical protein